MRAILSLRRCLSRLSLCTPTPPTGLSSILRATPTSVSAMKHQHEPTVDITQRINPAASQQAAPPADEWVGREVDHYRFERFLGEGGMARVYLARNLSLDRPCAIKVLRSSSRNRSLPVEPFLREARAAASLVHPHVVTIHTLGELADQHFIEMEFVDGPSLASAVNDVARFELLPATRLMIHVSSALAAAHQQGMIHRDVKPANVMLHRSTDAKLADFGLAKQIAADRAPHHRELCGTPHYMAPELFNGRLADPQTDVYSMGITFFELLTGRLPIQCDSLNDLIGLHIQRGEPDQDTLLGQLPADSADVISRCLTRDRSRRFQDAGELHEELCRVFRSLRSLKDLLQEAFAGMQVRIEGDGDHFTVRVSRADRSQGVHVELRNDDEVSEPVVRIFSPCAPVDENYFEKALQLNARIPYGGIGIDAVDGQPYFVMADAFPRATCDPDEVRHSVLSIAEHSDEVERFLTGGDQH